MNYIEHHGILGMKWGVRRYQNKDGSLTSAGKKRYSAKERQQIVRDRWNFYKDYKRVHPTAYLYEGKSYVKKQITEKYGKEAVNTLVTNDRVALGSIFLGLGMFAWSTKYPPFGD